MRLAKRSTVAIGLVLGVLTTSVARADEETARARMLYDEAGELERQGQWSAAQEKLRAALRIRETPHLRYALGWALENNDKLLEARTEYETAARLARERNVDEVSRLCTARLTELEKKTPVVQVRVPHAAAGATRVIVDGHAAAIQDDVVAVPVNPGSRVVRIDVADDSAVASRTGPQERHAKASTTIAKPLGTDRTPVLPWVLVGGGAALAVMGGALLVSASDADTRDLEQVSGITMGLAGLVSAGVGTWLLVTPTMNGALASATLPF